MESKMQMQKPKPIGYYSVCFYSLEGNPYPEENRWLNLKAKTYEGLVNKIKQVFKEQYLNDHCYRVSKELNGNYTDPPTVFTFEAAYIFGPKVRYHIYIKKIYSEDLTD